MPLISHIQKQKSDAIRRIKPGNRPESSQASSYWIHGQSTVHRSPAAHRQDEYETNALEDQAETDWHLAITPTNPLIHRSVNL